MIIEFTGCTGSGKSTLAEMICQRLNANGLKSHFRFEFLLGSFAAKTVKNSRARNMILDILALPFFPLFLIEHGAFARFALRILFRKPASFWGTLNRMRSIVRKMGLYMLLRKRVSHDTIIIVDEGIIHTAHNIFVYSTAAVTDQDLSEFARLVPLSDKIVFVSGPADRILARTLKRNDPPVRISSREVLETYINRAIDVFRRLEKSGPIKDKAVSVFLSEEGERALQEAADKLADYVLRKNNEHAG